MGSWLYVKGKSFIALISSASRRARHQLEVYSQYSTITSPPPPSPTRPGSPFITDSHAEGSLTTENHALHWTGKELTNQGRYTFFVVQHLATIADTRCDVGQVMSIDVLPDEVLLAIFDFCVDEHPFTNDEKKEIEAWQPLAHVCQRWRSVVFGSPHRLNLRLVCTSGTPARDTLDVWPALPLLVLASVFETSSVDNIIAVLEHSDRVCGIYLVVIPSSQLEKVSTAMRGPFPMLTNLRLHSDEETPVLPDSFLGGSSLGSRRSIIWD